MDRLSVLRDAVLNGDAAAAVAAARQAMADGTDPLAIVTQGFTPALKEAGRLFEEGEYFVPELLVSARASQAVFEIIRPLLQRRGVRPAGRIALGTVRGDVHDIGKNLVAAMLEGGGFAVDDLGVDVPPERFVAAAAAGQVDVVALSALLTTTMPAMQATIEALRAAGVRDRVKVIVGGAPLSASHASAIGADGYSENAAAAVALVRRLLGTPEPAGSPVEVTS